MAFLAKMLSLFGLRKKEANILVIGLDSSGKTTILNHFKDNEEKGEIVPTIGFAVEKFKYRNLSFTAFDMSGQGRYRNLWQHYYNGVDAIIFVIDSSDTLRMIVIKEELELLLKHEQLQMNPFLPILFCANKMDLKDALSSIKIVEHLGLNQIGERPWHIQVGYQFFLNG